MSRPFARTLLALSLPLAALLPVQATHASQPGKPVRQLIEHSHLIAPHQVADYRLADSRFDAGNLPSGAAFYYQHMRHPDVRFSVFVYPAGLGAQAATLARGMEEFHASLQQATQQIGLTTSHIEQAPFELLIPAASGKGRHRVPGNRLLLAQTQRGTALHSAGYLFYRGLYFYKLRVSVPEASMDRAAFTQLADHAARTLVPAITVMNVGGCGNDGTLYLPRDGSPEQIAATLTGQLMDMELRSCSSRLDAEALQEKSRDAEVIRINYPPNTWSEQ